MPEQMIRIKVHGLPELRHALAAVVDDLVNELRPGFVPLARYRGQEGLPFASEKAEIVISRNGFAGGMGGLL